MNYTIGDLPDYHRNIMDQDSKARMIKLINKFYGYIKELSDGERSKLFDYKIQYNTHEVNGSLIPNEMSIYQGYLLMTTTKILELVGEDIARIDNADNDREILYFTENAMNGLPLAYLPFGDYLYANMNSTYQDFIDFVLLCLFVIIGMMIILVIASTVCILLVRRMFKEIYNSFLNITEGEFEERSSQLNQVSDILNKFKQSFYFQDFMGYSTVDKVKTNTNKTNKKYVNHLYCFRLLFSVGFIVLFYMIQIIFSSGMMLIFRNNINKALWITHKQSIMNDLINNQLFFKNALMQKIVLGDDTKVMNKSVNVFLEEWKTSVKANSNIIFQLSEDGDVFIPYDDLQ